MLQHQAKADACTGAIDNGVMDIHLQHELKDHPSTQAQRGEVYCISFLIIWILVICIC